MNIQLVPKKLLVVTRIRQFVRNSSQITASRLFLNELGDPAKVVQKENFIIDASQLKENEVLVKMVQAPINPADINTIQGVYGVKPQLPFTLGNEGFGVVEKTGNKVQRLSPGDWVIPSVNAWGTWRTHAIDNEDSFLKVPNYMEPVSAATIAVNPATAYRMLLDFEKLDRDDVVLQNAANSAVGQSVIQIARHLGYRTVNIVRNREGVDKLKQDLKDLGANYVLTDEEFRGSKLFKGELPPPKLVLNCVSGKAVIDLVKAIAENGTLVTYGGMSRQPLVVPTTAFIFKNIRLVGYWMTRWNWQHKNSTDREEMLQSLCDMARRGILRPPKHQLVHINDYREAFVRSSNAAGFQEAKLIFYF